MAWWSGPRLRKQRDPQPDPDGVTLIDEHVLLFRRPVPAPQ